MSSLTENDVREYLQGVLSVWAPGVTELRDANDDQYRCTVWLNDQLHGEMAMTFTTLDELKEYAVTITVTEDYSE